MLQELIKYSYANKRKFDIVASIGMAELGDEEMVELFLNVRKNILVVDKILDDIKMNEV